MYLLFGISSFVHGKSIISHICVSPHLPKLGIQSIVIDKMFQHDVTIYLIFLFAFMVNYFCAMYISLPVNVDTVNSAGIAGAHMLVGQPTWRGPTFEIDKPHTGLLAMVDEAIVGIRFSTNFKAPELEQFDAIEFMCLLYFHISNLMFCVVCIILLVRLLMAMMTNTFKIVQEKAQLEWRLLLTRHVLRLELLGSELLGENAQERLFAGQKSHIDGERYHSFIKVQLQPGEAPSMPIQIARVQNGAVDWFDEDVLDSKGTRAKEGSRPAAAGLACLETPNASKSIRSSGVVESCRESCASAANPGRRQASAVAMDEMSAKLEALSRELRLRDEAHKAALLACEEALSKELRQRDEAHKAVILARDQYQRDMDQAHKMALEAQEGEQRDREAGDRQLARKRDEAHRAELASRDAEHSKALDTLGEDLRRVVGLLESKTGGKQAANQECKP